MSAEILFQLGNTVATHGAVEDMGAADTDASDLLQRHMRGDWGHACDAGQEMNKQALLTGGVVIGQYYVGEEELWVITQSDRQRTTILRPAERTNAEWHRKQEVGAAEGVAIAEGAGDAG